MSHKIKISVAGLSGKLPDPLSRVTLSVRYATDKIALIEIPLADPLVPNESCVEVYRRSLGELLEAIETWAEAREPIA
jgi:hypothetical protein